MALVIVEVRMTKGLVSKLERNSEGSGDYRSEDD